MNSPFVELGLSRELVEVLTALGYEEPTPIQREAIPPLLAGRDLLGQAATGTGKTAAFALPLLQRLTARTRAPRERTRRARARADARARDAGRRGDPPLRQARSAPSALPIYGGAVDGSRRSARSSAASTSSSPRRAARSTTSAASTLHARAAATRRARRGRRDARHGLRRGPRGDPRRDAEGAADRALLGDAAAAHRGDRRRRTCATRCGSDRRARSAAAGASPKVRQVAYVVPRAHKIAALGRILDIEQPTSAIVFCRTRTEVDELTETLDGRGYRAEALHGGLSQEQRDRVMKRFRARHGRPAHRHRRRGARARHRARSRTSSTTTCRPSPRRTCTASAAPAAPAARAWRSRSPSRASTACCATSSSSPGSRSRSRRCRPSPTCARAGSSSTRGRAARGDPGRRARRATASSSSRWPRSST